MANLKILAFKNNNDTVIELRPFERGDKLEKVYLSDYDEDGELFSGFCAVEVSFPDGDFNIKLLEKETELKAKDGIIHGLMPYEPAVNNTEAIVALITLEQLGFSFTWPQEFLDELKGDDDSEEEVF